MISGAARDPPSPPVPPAVTAMHVALGGRLVIVSSNAREVLVALRGHFRYLMAESPAPVVGGVRVDRVGDSYYMSADGEAPVHNQSFEEIVRCARHAVIRRLADATPELVWLHAGGVARAGLATIFAGAPGAGKSSLVTALCGRGWRYLSDEIVGIDPKTHLVVPFPLAPAFRVGPPAILTAGRVSGLPKTEADPGPAAVCWLPVPLSTIILPSFCPTEPSRLEYCSPALATLCLLRGAHSAGYDRAQLLRLLAGLVEQATVLRLSYRDRDEASDLIGGRSAASRTRAPR